MSNSKTEHSRKLRIKTSILHTKKLVDAGVAKNFKVVILEPYLTILNNLKISNAEFLRMALEKLDEHGNIKFNSEII